MSFCPQCGVQNPDAARFCDQCGTALVPTNTVAPAPSVAPSAPPSYTAPTAIAPAQVAAPANVAPTGGALICAQCGAAAIPGEAFCDNCGAPLNAPVRAAAPVPTPAYNPGVPPQPSYPPPQPSYSPPPAATVPSYPPPVASPTAATAPVVPLPAVSPSVATAPVVPSRTTLAPARLIIAATNAAVPLPISASVVIGRSDPVSKFSPDVDLTPYGALEQGVGRRHARLAVQSGQLVIEDLDSTNGTSVNGQKLSPRQTTVLRNGDTLQLGRLVVRIQE